uniref:Uncharacterized protein n=1 Tax=Candidatus Kentrum sp. DK TaxID=2126562 RepID=A0A450S4Z6_9GAMM|nr:MAG: hypothetical protein BECKDK2373C_GA0170839_101621 [Candidatus Kentron sp. DK]
MGLFPEEHDPKPPLGIVIKCGPMNGWYYKSLWEWRDEMEQRGI